MFFVAGSKDVGKCQDLDGLWSVQIFLKWENLNKVAKSFQNSFKIKCKKFSHLYNTNKVLSHGKQGKAEGIVMFFF